MHTLNLGTVLSKASLFKYTLDISQGSINELSSLYFPWFISIVNCVKKKKKTLDFLSPCYYSFFPQLFIGKRILTLHQLILVPTDFLFIERNSVFSTYHIIITFQWLFTLISLWGLVLFIMWLLWLHPLLLILASLKLFTFSFFVNKNSVFQLMDYNLSVLGDSSPIPAWEHVIWFF